MQTVKMLSSQMGSRDGKSAVWFIKGREYDIGDDLLKAFIDLGAVELIGKPKRETVAIHGAPEVKKNKNRETL